MKPFARSMLRGLLALAFALAGLPALAAIDLVGDDTDLFMFNPTVPSTIPNVLIILDNTSSWSRQSQQWPPMTDPVCLEAGITGNQQGDAEVCALYKVVGGVSEHIRIGMMKYADQQTAGGYVRFPVLQMEPTNRRAFREVLASINTNSPLDKGPSAATQVNIMNDAFRYFNSFPTFTGIQADRPGGPRSERADRRAYTSDARTAYQFGADGKDDACGYDYIIYIGNGLAATDSATPGITAAAALLNDPSVVVDTSLIQNTGRNADIWSKFLFQYGVKVSNGVYRHITTYTIDVCKDQCESGQETLLRSMASVSQGTYFKATNPEAIEYALKQILTEVQAKDSVFAATTLPVSINVRGTNLNQVYIGVFKPDARLSPRWLGNLKQYKLGVVNEEAGSLGLVDANNALAVNLNTGFISNIATSIWTQPSDFWAFRGPNYSHTDAGKHSDLPDGDLVEKGGAAQKIRQFYDLPDSTPAKSRNIYTCTGECVASAVHATKSELKRYAFNVANQDITAIQLGTFAGQTVNTLTGSGTTAKATINGGHTFQNGNQVVIAGATPAYYNGTFAVSAVTATTFEYTVTPSPNATVDTSRAYVTLPGYALVPGVDRVSVVASPATYTVTGAEIAAVVGNANQFSYGLAGGTTNESAAISSVTAHRKATSLVWTSETALNNVTATVPSHGYGNGDTVTIAGASDAAFNTTAVIANVSPNTFSYTAIAIPAGSATITGIATSASAHGLAAGDTVVVTGAAPAEFNTPATGSSISHVTESGFRYTTSAAVAGAATDPGVARRRIAADLNTYTVTGGLADRRIITLMLSGGLAGGTSLVDGQQVRTLAVGDWVAIQGVDCTPQGGGAPRVCSTTTDVPRPTSATPAGAPFTIQITAVDATAGSISFDAGGNVSDVLLREPKVYWTGATLSGAIALAGIDQGPATVSASAAAGQMLTTTKPGDLTSKVVSIASQGFATGDIVAALATAGDPAERANLIAWVRGADNIDNENNNADPTDIRASVHGDVLHSRPAVVNYNRTGDENDVYVFYGTNDGLLRAIKGGSLASGGGREAWAFVAPEFFGKLKRQRDQSPSISSVTPRDYFFDGPITVYTFDANKDGKLRAADGDKVYLFANMRRGGRMLYALDVSDPLNPKLLWRKGCRERSGSGTEAGSGDCDTGFGEIGHTWSEPKLAYLRKWPDTLALIFGAGNDPAVEDFQPCVVTGWNAERVQARTNLVPPIPMTATSCAAGSLGGTAVDRERTMGRGVFILNALTGEILWRVGPDSTAHRTVAGLGYAMPGDVAVLRNRTNTSTRTGDDRFENVPIGYVDRIYAADTGGNVWRIDVSDDGGESSDRPAFVVTKLASIAQLPQGGAHAAVNYRKFLYSPDVVYSSDAQGAYDAVLIGSGDREHPFDMIVENRFYMFKDRNIGSLTEEQVPLGAQPTPPAGIIEDTAAGTDLFDVTSNCLGGGECDAGQTMAGAQQALELARGWKLRLINTGEKTVAAATTAAGTVIFNTHQPKEDTVSGTAENTGVNAAANQCTSALGWARQYAINYQNAVSMNIFSALPTRFVEAGGRSATFAGGGFLPTPVPVVVQIGGRYYQTVISGVQATNPGGLKLQTRLRTYWYRKVD